MCRLSGSGAVDVDCQLYRLADSVEYLRWLVNIICNFIGNVCRFVVNALFQTSMDSDEQTQRPPPLPHPDGPNAANSPMNSPRGKRFTPTARPSPIFLYRIED